MIISNIHKKLNIQAKVDGKDLRLYVITILDVWPRQDVIKKHRVTHVDTLLMSVPDQWSKEGQDFEVGAPGMFVFKKQGLDQYSVAKYATCD